MSKKLTSAERRRFKVRNKIRRTSPGKLRLSVHRSSKNIYAQVIDDTTGRTLAAASSLDKELAGKVKNGANKDAAKIVGELVAKRAVAAGIDEVVFDRGGFVYHGRVQVLADAAREGGLKF